ncbi:MAG TPA: ferritin-like domain-containing protein [Firmicutes bacterium]|nr:ferritin-like domain-containing protein [Bacillota bacterium]
MGKNKDFPCGEWVLEEMLKVAMEDEKNDHIKYLKIAKMARRQRDKEKLLAIADDERRHRRWLMAIYKNLYGNRRLNLQERPKKLYRFDEAIGKSVIAEYEGIAFYREILGRIPCEEMKNVIRRIMEDEQRHACILEDMLGFCHCRRK